MANNKPFRDALLGLLPDGVRMLDTVASGPNEIDGETLKAIRHVTTGQRCRLLKQGDSPPIILGPISGPITLTATPAAGWNPVSVSYAFRDGPQLFFRVNATRTGSPLGTGDIANSTVCTLAGATGTLGAAQGLSQVGGPVVSAIYTASTGIVQIAATATGVATSAVIQLSGVVWIA